MSRLAPPTVCCRATWKGSMCATKRQDGSLFLLCVGHWTSGSPRLERFNGFPSMNILGESAPERSSGEAMQHMQDFIKDLPRGVGFDWTGLSYQERQAGAQTAPFTPFPFW